MTDVTQILHAIRSGDRRAAEQLLPLVYQELRRLAEAKMRGEAPEHTLQATALVHEAYLRLVGDDGQRDPGWNSRGHFFGAAAEAMRRILVESARARSAAKRGGGWQRMELDAVVHPASHQPDKLLALDEALRKLQSEDKTKAELVKLRFFAGLTNKQAAAALEISPATADRYWALARAWLKVQLESEGQSP